MIALQRHAGHLASDATELRQVFSWVPSGRRFPTSWGRFWRACSLTPAFRSAYLLLALLPSRLVVGEGVRRMFCRRRGPAVQGSAWEPAEAGFFAA